MLTDIRLRSQQLARPEFKDPKDLVSWMGASRHKSIEWLSGRWNTAEISYITDY